MASSPAPIAFAATPSPPIAASADRAVFTLLRPIRAIVDGVEVDLAGFDMRALAPADLPLLDRFHGQPIALAQHVVAALCDLTVDQVRQLDIEDFTMIASDALFQVEQLSVAMGLAPDLFVQPRPHSGSC